MTCTNCRQNGLLDKLGRCRDCQIKSAVLTLVCIMGWLIAYAVSAQPLTQQVWILGAVAFGGLWLLHRLFAWFYRRQETHATPTGE